MLLKTHIFFNRIITIFQNICFLSLFFIQKKNFKKKKKKTNVLKNKKKCFKNVIIFFIFRTFLLIWFFFFILKKMNFFFICVFFLFLPDLFHYIFILHFFLKTRNSTHYYEMNNTFQHVEAERIKTFVPLPRHHFRKSRQIPQKKWNIFQTFFIFLCSATSSTVFKENDRTEKKENNSFFTLSNTKKY